MFWVCSNDFVICYDYGLFFFSMKELEVILNADAQLYVGFVEI